MKRNVWCWAAILGATTLAPIPGLAQDTIPTAVVVKVLSDSSYIVQIRGRRLIVITESVFQRLLQADEERRGLKDKLRGADSVSAAQQHALDWSDSTLRHKNEQLAQLDSLYHRERDISKGWRSLAGEPWLTFDFGLGETGRDHNPAVLAGLGIRRFRIWGFLQEANAGGAIGMSLRLF